MIVHLLSIFILCTIGIKNVQCSVSSDSKFDLTSTNETSQPPGNCDPGQKACGPYCCPYPDGVCCIGCNQCCRKGQVCLPYTGLCFDTKYEHGKLGLISTKATDLIETCPSHTTACGKDRCCMLPDATCCSDGEHCCPNGYSCDLKKQKCVKSEKWFTVFNASEKRVSRKFASKIAMKFCPGGSHQCPAYSTSCCLSDNGSWGCCPNPPIIYSYKLLEAADRDVDTIPPCDPTICVLPECYCPTSGT